MFIFSLQSRYILSQTICFFLCTFICTRFKEEEMLKLCDIKKKYVTGELVQTALDGVTLNLRIMSLLQY